MFKNVSIKAIILISMTFQACTPNEPNLTLQIPEEGFKVVQQIPEKTKGRDQNTLYQAPIKIKSKEFNSSELNVYMDSMYAVMLRTNGVGIASNQLGKRLQIFIIEAQADNPRYQVLGAVPKQVFINPKITKTSKNRMNFWHGCLSAHGEERGNVATYEWIEYSCRNQKGELQEGRLNGFAAVIFQHEFRHMMGGTYLDCANHFLPKEVLDQKIEAGELPFFETASDTLPLLIKGYVIGESLEEYFKNKSTH